MPPLVRYFVFAVAGYATFTGALFLGQRRLLYHPDATAPDPARAGVADMAEVRVPTADGLELLAWYRPADEGRPTLLYLHGNAGNLDYRGVKARPFLDAGYGVLLLAWRGFSGNPGSPTEDGLYADARAAIAFLGARGVSADRLVLYGESLGSGVAVRMASEITPAALVLEAPFTSIVDIAAYHYWYAPVRWMVSDRYDSLARIAAVETPLLILHGERDAVTPIRFGRALFDAAREPKTMTAFPEAGHGDLYDFGAGATVLKFLDRLTPDEGASGSRPTATAAPGGRIP